MDIDYDDGEKEIGVEKDYVRLRVAGGGRGSSSDRIEEGSKVEAGTAASGATTPAASRDVRRDGTYDIDYDDGEKEIGVEEDRRLAKWRAIAARGRRHDVDRSRRAPRSRPARARAATTRAAISRARLNGTYDIDYDDGEKETAWRRINVLAWRVAERWRRRVGRSRG